MWVKGTFYAFMCSSAYLFLKRFYLKELLGFLLYTLITLCTYFFELLSSINFDVSILRWIDLDGTERGVASEMVRSAYGGDAGLLYQYQ
jgi:hypothetical protein